MRGLTTEERSALVGETATSEQVWRALIARGLAVVTSVQRVTWEGRAATLHEGELTPDGHLALRLDAAARQLSGVSA